MVTHWPREQNAPSAHCTPQRPQFLASAWVSVHWPLHSKSGALQLQLPAMHSSSALQVVPHAPQLRRSDVTSMQLPLQNDWPLGQLWEQVPAWHTAPAAHARPQAPQLASSV